jgi:hypothetical protein
MREESRRGGEDPEKAITGEDNRQDKAEELSALDSGEYASGGSEGSYGGRLEVG